MQRIYLDNAATTSLDSAVLEAMMPFLTENFGNPSSIYSYGRETKMAIEKARKSVAKNLNARPAEIFFTSGGTESTNTAIMAAVHDLGCKRIISSPLEHHATLHSVEFCNQHEKIPVDLVKLDEKGRVDLNSLKELLASSEEKCLVTLMHANNEVGNLLPIEKVGELCKEYNAVFHCDAVQTIGHYPIDLKNSGAHFASCAAHKFHGPKGVGMLYINENITIKPMINGGAQERNMRAGTENIYGIVGLAKALEIALADLEQDSAHISGLKKYMAEQIKNHFPDTCFNGDYDGESLYTVLNVGFPHNDKTEMLLMNLDIAGICVSGGSACSSGAQKGSHVISAICPEKEQIPIRFSFAKHNTKDEIDFTIQKIKELL